MPNRHFIPLAARRNKKALLIASVLDVTVIVDINSSTTADL
jgi:hypothetical protein